MPIEVEIKGQNTVVEFPDGMSDEEISAAIQKNYPTNKSLDLGTGEEGQYDFSPKPIPVTPIRPDAIRPDKTLKGKGFLGELPMTDGSGRVMTEFSVGVNIGGKEIDVPTLVPTLTKEEVDYLRSGGEVTAPIAKKAYDYAKMRTGSGLSPFKADNETPYGNMNIGAKNKTFAENWNQAASAESDMMSRPENLPAMGAAASGLVSWVPAGMVKAAGIASGQLPEANELADAIQKGMTPNLSPTGEGVVGAFSKPFEMLSQGATNAADWTFDKTGSPVLATAVKTGIESLPYGVGMKALRVVRGLPKNLEIALSAQAKEARMRGWQEKGLDVPVSSGEVSAPKLYPTAIVIPLSDRTPNKAPDTKAYITPEGAVIYIEKGDGIYTPMSNTLDGTPMPIRHTALRPSKDLKKVQYEMEKFVAKTNYNEAPNIIKINTPPPEQPVGPQTPQGTPLPEAPLESRSITPPEITPPSSATPPTVEDILGSDSPVAATYRWQADEINKLKTETHFWDSMARAIVDVSEPAKRKIRKLGPTGKEAEMRRDLIIHAPTAAGQIFKDVAPLIYDDLTVGETQLLDQLIQSKRVVEIESYKFNMGHATAPEYRGPEGKSSLTGEQHLTHLKNIDQLLPPVKARLYERADRYFQTMKEQVLEPLYKEGLLNDEQMAALQLHIYEPRKFLQHVDPGHRAGGVKHITSPDSGIKKLDEGSLQAMELDSQLLLADAISRTQGRIFTNRANQSLYEIALNDPIFPGEEIIPGKNPKGNGIVRLLKPYENARPGYDVVTAMVEGKQQRLELPNHIYESWVVSDPIFNAIHSKIFKWGSGAEPLKMIATGYNPAFAVTNMFRDMAHILLSTNQYSSFIPKAIPQLGWDYISTARDAWQVGKVGGKWERTGKQYTDYQRSGGMGEYLTHQGKGGYVTDTRLLGIRTKKGPTMKKLEPGLEGLSKFLGYIGESSEIWSRLALRRRALKNGATPSEATWQANNYLDFLQGGNVAKAADVVMPYLNAAIQGTRGIFRAAHRDPVIFSWKVAQLATISSLLYLANIENHPEMMKNASPKERSGNFLFPTGGSFIDKNGDERFNYFKIAKDQSQRIICTLIDSFWERIYEGKIPTDELFDSLFDFIPVGAKSVVPPTWQAWMAYAYNKDTYTMDDVWPNLNKRFPYLESNKQDNPFWVKMGELSKDVLGEESSFSPRRMGRASTKIFPEGNPFVAMIGGTVKMMMEADKTGETYATINEELVNNPTIKRLYNATPGIPLWKRRELDKATVAYNSKTAIQNTKIQEIVESNKGDEFAQRKKATEYISNQPYDEYERLNGRLEDEMVYITLKGDRSYWRNLKNQQPKDRAKLYLEELMRTKPNKVEEKKAIANSIPGFYSEDFMDEYYMLAKKANFKNP